MTGNQRTPKSRAHPAAPRGPPPQVHSPRTSPRLPFRPPGKRDVYLRPQETANRKSPRPRKPPRSPPPRPPRDPLEGSHRPVRAGAGHPRWEEGLDDGAFSLLRITSQLASRSWLCAPFPPSPRPRELQRLLDPPPPPPLNRPTVTSGPPRSGGTGRTPPERPLAPPPSPALSPALRPPSASGSAPRSPRTPLVPPFGPPERPDPAPRNHRTFSVPPPQGSAPCGPSRPSRALPPAATAPSPPSNHICVAAAARTYWAAGPLGGPGARRLPGTSSASSSGYAVPIRGVP
ncbi:basic salivary proline-rich protein 2-like [Meles meles]|uniref:basic salivary proline-rich protein 2-like n=1 Tax=Meles meles TaxID=9662 RepID=UPI001E6A0331|nr:basic salivary proline-rich protein 2-like [Meles meles]